MIILNLITENGKQTEKKYPSTSFLLEALKDLDYHESIFLAADDNEIIITENLQTLIDAIRNGYFNLLWESPQHFYVQLYSSYEDAYSVALNMKEINPKCYAK